MRPSATFVAFTALLGLSAPILFAAQDPCTERALTVYQPLTECLLRTTLGVGDELKCFETYRLLFDGSELATPASAWQAAVTRGDFNDRFASPAQVAVGGTFNFQCPLRGYFGIANSTATTAFDCPYCVRLGKAALRCLLTKRIRKSQQTYAKVDETYTKCIAPLLRKGTVWCNVADVTAATDGGRLSEYAFDRRGVNKAVLTVNYFTFCREGNTITATRNGTRISFQYSDGTAVRTQPLPTQQPL